MQSHTSTANTLTPASTTRRSVAIAKPVQLICAFVLGAVILYAAGFVNTSAVHNAAHDMRHSQGFPCH